MAAAEAEESRARRGREEGGGTCYNATHEAVVANGNEQDDRRERERRDGCLCLRPKRGNAPSSQHGSLGRERVRRRRQSSGFNVEMDHIEMHHHGMRMV